jgi:hypothetical protein
MGELSPVDIDKIGFRKTIKDFELKRIWVYRNPDGSVLFYRARYEDKQNKKQIYPYYTGPDGKLIMKQPPGILIPPLKADELFQNEKAEFLLVEGEKCATCKTAQNIEKTGVIVSTLATTPEKSDLSLLKYRHGYYLPDADKPGYEKALEIKRAIPGIEIIPPFPEWKDGQSIDDFDIDGNEFFVYVETVDMLEIADLEKILEIKHPPGTIKDAGPFSFLGYDEKYHYFLPKDQNIPIKISRGNVALKNNIQEIAPLGWWFSRFERETKSGVCLDESAAITWLRKCSIRKGIFDNDAILGVGPHRDGDKIIINTGRNLTIFGNGTIDYTEYDGPLVFCRSRFHFEITGNPWGREQRKQFVEAVKTFNFEKNYMLVALVGWCAVAPFASILTRRPHIWITAKKGTGKSFLIENIIEPLLGSFLIKSEGKTTEAAIRQATGRDCRPVIIDEFGINSKFDIATIENVLGLARSAYGGYEILKGTPSQEVIHFRTKMMFCFAFTETYLSNAANASRIVIIRLKQSVGKMGAIPPAVGLRKMMFDRLPELIQNCELARDFIISLGFEERTGDTYGPLFAGFWMIISDKPFLQGKDKENEFVRKSIMDLGEEKTVEDEDRILSYIFDYSVKIDPSLSLTISEMLMIKESGSLGGGLKYEDILKRIGIKRTTKKVNEEDIEVLAIAAKHQEISKILSETAFDDYKEVLARHPAFLEGNNRKFPIMFLTKNTQVILLDWKKIYNEFFDQTPRDADDEIPF